MAVLSKPVPENEYEREHGMALRALAVALHQAEECDCGSIMRIQVNKVPCGQLKSSALPKPETAVVLSSAARETRVAKRPSPGIPSIMAKLSSKKKSPGTKRPCCAKKSCCAKKICCARNKKMTRLVPHLRSLLPETPVYTLDEQIAIIRTLVPPPPPIRPIDILLFEARKLNYKLDNAIASLNWQMEELTRMMNELREQYSRY